MGEEKKAKERIRELIALQKRLRESYGEDNYNVFVFGSYATTSYDDERSDVDVAVYTPDMELYKQLSIEIDDFFDKRRIPVDLFYIDTSLPAPIYLAPLRAQIQFTDYFPKKLKLFEEKCDLELKRIKKKIDYEVR